MNQKMVFIFLSFFIFFLSAEEGCLDITSVPLGADVEINGESLGKTPLKNHCVKDGRYLVSVKSPCHENNFGHNINRVVNVVKGGRHALDIKLTPVYQRASFNVVDENGKTLEDVTLIAESGETATIPGTVNLPVCKTGIVFAKDGYNDINFVLDISKPATVSVKMTKNDKPSKVLTENREKMASSRVTVKDGDRIVVSKSTVPAEELVVKTKAVKKEISVSGKEESKPYIPPVEKRSFGEIFPFFKIGFPIALAGFATMAVGMYYNTETTKAYNRYYELTDPVFLEKVSKKEYFDAQYYYERVMKIKKRGDEHKKKRNILYITGGAVMGAGLILSFIPSRKKDSGKVLVLPSFFGEEGSYGLSLTISY